MRPAVPTFVTLCEAVLRAHADQVAEPGAAKVPSPSVFLRIEAIEPSPDREAVVDVTQARELLSWLKATPEDLALSHGHSEQIAGELLAERRRQVDAEGFTPKHDETQPYFVLARAAATYAWSGSFSAQRERAWLVYPWPDFGQPGSMVGAVIERLWPWQWQWWKPKDARRDLIRAGGLTIAAIERMDRDALMTADADG